MMKTRRWMAAAISLSMAAILALPVLAAEAVTEGGTEASADAAGSASSSIPSILDYDLKDAVTDEEAVSLALEHAGLTEDQVERQRVEYDRDDGLNVLEVEFYGADSEYDYTVDLDGGRIISASYDMPDLLRYDLPSLAEPLSDSEAAKLVMDAVPDVTEQDMWIEADRDDGRIYYEIDFVLGDVEYNFDIDAESGEIVSWEQELTDRSLYGGRSSSNARADHHDEDHHDDDWDRWDD